MAGGSDCRARLRSTRRRRVLQSQRISIPVAHSLKWTKISQAEASAPNSPFYQSSSFSCPVCFWLKKKKCWCLFLLPVTTCWAPSPAPHRRRRRRTLLHRKSGLGRRRVPVCIGAGLAWCVDPSRLGLDLFSWYVTLAWLDVQKFILLSGTCLLPVCYLWASPDLFLLTQFSWALTCCRCCVLHCFPCIQLKIVVWMPLVPWQQ
jgi:hypothetical protein